MHASTSRPVPMRPATRGRNLSTAVSLLVREQRASEDRFEDLAAFHAPGECYRDVERAEQRRARVLRRRIKALTGLPYRAFLREVTRRTSPRFVHFHLAGGR